MHLLVVHGMARTSLSLAPLARHLRKDGHRVTLTGYVAALEHFDAVCRTGAEPTRGTCGPNRALRGYRTLIGGPHPPGSPGGAPLHPAPRRLIMLGHSQPAAPPGATVSTLLWPLPHCQWTGWPVARRSPVLRDAAADSRAVHDHRRHGGSRGRWSLFRDDPNDGTVAVAETLAAPNDHPILVPARHTFLMNHPDVRRAVRRVLADAGGAESSV